MTKAQQATYYQLCYSCPQWRARKLAQNKAYQQTPAGQAWERARRQTPARQAYMREYRAKRRQTNL